MTKIKCFLLGGKERGGTQSMQPIYGLSEFVAGARLTTPPPKTRAPLPPSQLGGDDGSCCPTQLEGPRAVSAARTDPGWASRPTPRPFGGPLIAPLTERLTILAAPSDLPSPFPSLPVSPAQKAGSADYGSREEAKIAHYSRKWLSRRGW